MSSTRIAVASVLLLFVALLLGVGLGFEGFHVLEDESLSIEGIDLTEDVAAALAGIWRAVLLSPGGELPFTLDIDTPGSYPPATAHNGEERVPFSTITVRPGPVIVLRIDGYDSEFVATLSEDRDRLTGYWTRTIRNGQASLPFTANRGDSRRFLPESHEDPLTASAAENISGTWVVAFSRSDGSTSPAIAEFMQDGHRVVGTFLTPTADHRYLEGDYRSGQLRLSAFDGTHAFLYHAEQIADGTLRGDFWSRDVSHQTWSARRLQPGEDATLPDPFAEVGLVNTDGRFEVTLPDLGGQLVSLEQFRGMVLIVNIFGSWCPNCNDEAPLLADWYRRYHDRGLEIVGLAFEVSGDPKRDVQYVRKYAERHAIEYPLLLGGTVDKRAASTDVLTDLTELVAFPTTLFLDRKGIVRAIYSGYSGPGTGDHHVRLVAELEAIVEDLLDQDAG